MPLYYVYVYYDPRNGDAIYVGLVKGKRAFKHWKKKANNQFFQNVLNKIREAGQQPRIEFVIRDVSYEQAKSLEVELIALHGRRDLGKGTLCNLTDGGDGAKGLQISSERRIAQKEIADDYWRNADRESHGAKISAVFAARTEDELSVVRENIRRSRTDEVRVKIGEASKLRMMDNAFREKVLTSLQTVEAREKRKATSKARHINAGEKNGRCKLSDADIAEIKVKISNGVFQKDIAEIYGINQSTISKIANGHRRTISQRSI
jgi:hypothetical protein